MLLPHHIGAQTPLQIETTLRPAEPEWMDRPQPVSPELMSDLENLRALNRFFGSYRLVNPFLCGAGLAQATTCASSIWRPVPAIFPDSWLVHAQSWCASANRCGDFQGSTIRNRAAAQRRLCRNPLPLRGYPSIREKQAYDIVLFSLALHHFSANDAVQLLRRCRELSRGHVLVADLRRGWLAKVGVDLLTTVFFREGDDAQRCPRFGGPSFSFQELDDLARQAGWTNFGHRRFRFARQAIWLERPPLGLSK
jgi:hypothetical protein